MSLYHYTKLSNIEKIVRPDIINLIATYYEKFAKDDYAWIREEGKTLVKELCEELGYNYDPDYLAHRPYIVSFCTSPNSDYMWKEFGEDGDGVALMFNEQILREHASLIDNYSQIIPCEYIDTNYDREKKKAAILKIAKSNYLEACPDDDKLMFAVMGVMQNRFYYEQEIRYVQIEKLLYTVRYLEGNAHVEKYIVPTDKWTKHICFSKDILDGIILGKNVGKHDFEYFKNYMHEYGYGFDKIFIAQ